MTHFLEYNTDLSGPGIASAFDQLSVWSSRFGALLLDHIPLAPNLNILDLACGAGFPLFELAQIYGHSCRIVGVDLWKEALVRARLKLDFQPFPNVRLLEANGARLPFTEAKFDLVVSNLGINNFENAETAMAECYRVTKPEGKLVLTTNLTGHMQEFYTVYRDTLMRLNKTHYLDNLNHNEQHRGTKESICGLLEAAGYKIVKVVEDKFSMRFVNGSTLFNHLLTLYGFLDAWRAVVKLEDEDEVFSAIEARLNKIARQNGELKMTIPMLYVEGQKR